MRAKTLQTLAPDTAQDTGKGKASAPGPAAGRAWTVPGVRLKLAYVAPGSFQMGSNEGEADEKPVHEVQLSHGFWMGTVAVTQAEYKAVMLGGAESASGAGTDPSTFKDARHPVETVSWDDAVAFCEKLTVRERVAGRLPAGHEYRLPTEAEWEYAARGGSESRGFTYSGSNSATEVAWHDANSGNCTHPVGQKQPNELGLYDMSGNVWEWTCSAWANPYDGAEQRCVSNSDAKSARVVRGGSWYVISRNARAAIRSYFVPEFRYFNLGLRLARTLSP